MIRVRTGWRWLARPLRFPTLALVLMTAAIFVMAVRLTTVQPDTWWSLRAGKDMWHSHHFIKTDTYSFTAYGQPWPDHEWLYQVLLYGLYVVGRLPLISLVHAALAAGAVLIARPRGRATWADVVAIAPIIALVSVTWSVRPEMVSLFLLAIMVRLLQAERWLAIVVVMLVWANLHGEVAAGGLLLVAATVASLAAWLLGLRRGDEADHRRRRRRFFSYALTSVASAVATLVNPMGWGLWRYIVTLSGRPGQGWIAEWQPSWTAPWITGWFWAWCAVLIAVIAWRWRRLGQWPVLLDLCMALAMAPLGWMAIRNISVFGIVTIPLLIRLARRQGPPRPVRPGSLLPGAPIVIALALVATVVATTRTLRSPGDLDWTPMSPAAAQAIDRCPGGRAYTTYNTGAYLIWFTPDVKVFVDNRRDPYSAQILDLSGLTPGMDYEPVFKKYDIQCAALTMSDASSLVTLGALGGWTIQYADDSWVVLTPPPSTPKK